MLRINNIALNFENEKGLKKAIAKKLNTKDNFEFNVVKKAIDARKKDSIKFVFSVDVEIKNEKRFLKQKDISIVEKFEYKIEKKTFDKSPIIIGSGPAGLFCALSLAHSGANPIVVEQGSRADDRKIKIDSFFEKGILDLYNNIQFGEGGAGTFSDGKLTTNIKDEKIKFILQKFVENGAPKEILYKAKPHIGTDYLVQVVQSIRKEIEALGGKVIFDTEFIEYKQDESGSTLAILKNTKTNETTEILTNNLILAIGHSSRKTFKYLYENGIVMEPKPFSVGFRIEHLQSFINETQYNCEIASDDEKINILGSAEYKINAHLDSGKGVYTFCMCPGGLVVNATSEECSVLTNGMSNFKRNEKNANSAVLLSVDRKDFINLTGDETALAGIKFQQYFENLAFEIGGKNYNAPVQMVSDYLNNVETKALGQVIPTIKPDYKLVNFNEHLPKEFNDELKKGLILLNDKIKGFIDNDSIITGFETRSSSPIRIIRDNNYLTNENNIYVCGEGCGYAGGITSSAIDGLNCAEKILGNS